jgi:tRNA A-37 threonylcarbamoyl transferase component Bud32
MNAVQTIADTVGTALRWEVAPEHRATLLNGNRFRLAEWLEAGHARVVKHGPHRTVYHVTLPGLAFYLKHFRLADRRAWLRGLVRSSKARMEFDRACAVTARGVPTVTPLAVGETPGWRPGESWLATLALEDVTPLDRFLESDLPTYSAGHQAWLRRRVADVLAALLARMHDAGIRHDDLHPGNVLMRLNADDEPCLFLIDLHAVHLGRALAWPAARANLVLLNHWFTLRASRSDRLRFWRAYAKARGLADGASLARDLECRTWHSNLVFWRSRDARCVQTNRRYRRLGGEPGSASPVAGMAVTDLDAASLQPLMSDPDAPFSRPEIGLLKDGPTSTVAPLTVDLEGVPRPAIYKRVRRRAGWKDGLGPLRPDALLGSWVGGHGLRERCLPTPRPLAVLGRGPGAGGPASYLLTAKIEDAVDLRAHVGSLTGNRDVFRRQIDPLARLVREMHRRGVSHRDLKAANILVQSRKVQVPGAWDDFSSAAFDFGPFWLIDLVGVRLQRRVSRRRRVQNLARLNASFQDQAAVTRADRLRFLRVYLQWGLLGRCGWKAWWRQIGHATQAKVCRNRRNGRPLA